MDFLFFLFSVSFSFFSFLGDMCVFKNLILFKETNKRRNRSQESKPMSYGGEQFGKGRGGKEEKERGGRATSSSSNPTFSGNCCLWDVYGCFFFVFLNSFFNSFNFL